MEELVFNNNEEMFFLAKNSYGTGWGDQGLFRLVPVVAAALGAEQVLVCAES